MIEKLRSIGQFGNLHPTYADRAVARLRRPADRLYQARSTRVRGLARLRGRSSAGEDAPRVLVASLRGWSTHIAHELLIAHALRVRGAEVALLTCGGGMPACEVGWSRRAYPRPCDRCGWLTDRVADESGLAHFALRDYIPWGQDSRRAPTDGNAAGALADAYDRSRISLTWLMRATEVQRVPDGPQAREDFAVAAVGVRAAVGTILDTFRPNVVFLLNGLFAAENVIRQVALDRGLRVPTYETAPRGGCIVVSQGAPAPRYDTDELWRTSRDQPLTERQRENILALLRGREKGLGAHERYFDQPEADLSKLRRRLALPDGKRIFTLFTNVSWDSAAFARDVGFSSMLDWIITAVRLAGERDDLTLLIRVHPAEERWRTREQVEPEVLGAVGAIPANVRIVAATEPVSSYALLDLSDLVLTYTTTVGLEAAVRGKPVAVAGDTHYRSRGFTIDLAGPADLASVLASRPSPLNSAEKELALRYAFAFFFRGMVPFPATAARGPTVTRLPTSVSQLRPGFDPFLDWVCDRILDGDDFTLPDELATTVERVAPSAVRNSAQSANNSDG